MSKILHFISVKDASSCTKERTIFLFPPIILKKIKLLWLVTCVYLA